METIINLNFIKEIAEKYKDIATCIRVLETYLPQKHISDIIYNLNKQMEEYEVAVLKHIFGNKSKLAELCDNTKPNISYEDLPF